MSAARQLNFSSVSEEANHAVYWAITFYTLFSTQPMSYSVQRRTI